MDAKTKILVADRSPVSQNVLPGILSNWGFDVMVAADGVEACALLAAEDGPRLAILDSRMAAMDAVEICRRVRSMNRLDYLLLVAENASFEELEAGMNAGADDYITRPFDWLELRARLQVGCRVVKLQERLVRAREDLYDQATRDGLTGLWNRVAIIQTLDSELARASRGGSPLGIVMADIDHFKLVNDTYGHLAGDAVLCDAARRMSSVLRKYDSIGRYGGEEFLIVIPGCRFEDGLAVAERLREAVGDEPYAVFDDVCQTTASLGLAWNDGAHPADVKRLLREADSALYSAKRRGRNRVEVFDTSTAISEARAGVVTKSHLVAETFLI